MGELAFKNQNSRTTDIDISDLGKPDTFRYNILTMVINEEYDRAIKLLKDFIASDSPYPNFRMRIERYATHAIDLIYAIRTKRNFPGLSALTRTKQQELKDKFKEHFSELRFMMKKIEDCCEELRLNDVRSTHIVVRSFILALTVVFVCGLSIDLFNGLGDTVHLVTDEYLDKAFSFLYNKLL
jgi:hypothetical protein